MSEGNGKNEEIMVFLDSLPGLIRMGQIDMAKDFLRKRFEQMLPDRITRYGMLPSLSVKLEPFNSLVQEMRSLYIDGCFRGAIALCGMSVEALCIAVAEERVTDKELRQKLTDPLNEKIRDKIKCLEKYFRIQETASLLHRVLDIRKEYIHLHKTQILPQEVLECINNTHLAIILEYGLIPTEAGKVRSVTQEDVDNLKSQLG